MKYCEEYAALISAAVDNALTADERRNLMDHLAQCPACREAYTQMMTMHEAFADWEEQLPGDLTASVMASIRKEKAVAKSRKCSWLPLLAAAACCALVFIGYQGLQFTPNTAADTAAPVNSAKSAAEESSTVADAATETADTAAAAQDNDAVTYTSSREDILFGESEEQLLEGVLTYFSGAPVENTELLDVDETPAADAAAAADNQILLLTSGESALVTWIAENTTAVGHVSEEDDTTAWLISEEECRALTAWLTEEGLLWEQYLVELPHPDEKGLVCVVYLPT